MDLRSADHRDWEELESKLIGDSRSKAQDASDSMMRSRRYEAKNARRAAPDGIHRRRKKRIDW
jgi:hypothetical protein